MNRCIICDTTESHIYHLTDNGYICDYCNDIISETLLEMTLLDNLNVLEDGEIPTLPIDE